MKRKNLTITALISEAKIFCEAESKNNHKELVGITDGKAVGTYVEHRFKEYLLSRYDCEVGNSASGIDLPSERINTDIKVTAATQPQSSCPFKDTRQKIYGLGYNLLVMVYEKKDGDGSCSLSFTNCSFIESERTGDFTITKRIIEMVKDGANKDDFVAYLTDRGLPGDHIVLEKIADEILRTPPRQGYLTISNALQWRLQYKRVISLKNAIAGITNYDWE